MRLGTQANYFLAGYHVKPRPVHSECSPWLQGLSLQAKFTATPYKPGEVSEHAEASFVSAELPTDALGASDIGPNIGHIVNRGGENRTQYRTIEQPHAEMNTLFIHCEFVTGQLASCVHPGGTT